MTLVLGIDVGGTYTDSAIINLNTKDLLHKSKILTTKNDFSFCVHDSLKSIDSRLLRKVSMIVLSTTLATNAVVENNGRNVATILIGKEINEDLPCQNVVCVRGGIDIKGRITFPLDKERLFDHASVIAPSVDAFAVSSLMAVKNPLLEQEAKRLLKTFGKPVISSHEIAPQLGYYERTITTILNARLLNVINEFLCAVEKSLNQMGLKIPIYILKGDGALASLSIIKNRPVDTILSGPAASIAGAIFMTDIDDGVIADIGGTTTDIALIEGSQVPIVESGARIAQWQTKVKSAEIFTFGLGGDSKINVDARGRVKIGPSRINPACRNDLPTYLTPTDLLHISREYTKWDREKSCLSIQNILQRTPFDSVDLLYSEIENNILKMIYENCIKKYDPKLPLIGVGAPAKAWFSKASTKYGFKLNIPENYEVANAVGAAVAQLSEKFTATIRPFHEVGTYLVFTQNGRLSKPDKESAVSSALNLMKKQALQTAKSNKLTKYNMKENTVDKYSSDHEYLETIVEVKLSGRIIN